MNNNEESFRQALTAMLDEIEKSGIEISEEELDNRVTELSKAYGFDLKPEKARKGMTTCPSCGAPLHNNQCQYCGNNYNFL